MTRLSCACCCSRDPYGYRFLKTSASVLLYPTHSSSCGPAFHSFPCDGAPGFSESRQPRVGGPAARLEAAEGEVANVLVPAVTESPVLGGWPPVCVAEFSSGTVVAAV